LVLHRPPRYSSTLSCFCFFFTALASAAIHTLSLHDALPIFRSAPAARPCCAPRCFPRWPATSRRRGRKLGSLPVGGTPGSEPSRSEEHTSELQSHLNLVCRLLLEKKKPIQRAEITEYDVTVK